MRDAEARRRLRSPSTFTPFAIADCDQTIHHRFEQRARERPDAVAVRLLSGDKSYGELNTTADRGARRLRATIGSSEGAVAMLTPQGYSAIVWTLAILKAGLAYAPLDQRLPASILRRMVDDLGPAALLAAARHRDLAIAIAADRCPLLEVDGDDRVDARSANLDRPVGADDFAYIFYTSGSTGRAKGVADSHRHVLHNVLRYTNTLRFAPGDRLSLVQNPSFSGTVSSLFGALLNGASIAPYDLLDDGLANLSAWVRRAQVTVFHAVPSIFRELSDPIHRFLDVRLVRLEGDRASSRDVEHFRSNFRDDCMLVNGLGATECGLVRQFFVDMHTSADPAAVLPIGYPVPDVAVRIVDDQGRDVPCDAAGEIVVESRFLAAGYWHNPDLTSQRFEDVADGVRRYRTGDLGKLQHDGCLVHLGRVDHRIRLAGEFIDTEDIERALLSVPGIAHVVVQDFVDEGHERRLCAYLVRDAASVVTVAQLRQALVSRVAPPAIPSAFMFLDALPLSKDLKVDRARLPRPGRGRPEMPNDYVPPSSALEQRLAQAWSEVLNIDEVGVTDSLFALGGDSLQAARIVSRLRSTLGDRIQVTSLFEHSTIRALAGAIEPEESVTLQAATIRDTASEPDHRIAIIGMAGRFPGAATIDQFWDNLRAGHESITFFRPDEVDDADVTADDPRFVLARGLIEDVDRFDAPLFGLTPRQAQMLDPQQRVWLECVHQAMEDAGLPVGGVERGAEANVGVFAGGRESTYLWQLVGGDRRSVAALLSGSTEDALELLNSNDGDSLATRTSFLFGFTGPSLNVQTACSSSLVAVAQACQALVSAQCEVAVAGGVTVTFPQKRGHRHLVGGIHSRDGHCRPFDADASGTVFSDGVGVVILKRLEHARADGDRIDAVIRGWAVNNDGASKASFTAPSVEGQARVIAQAQRHAGVRPSEISYVEAHGTGTPVGDPIEYRALARAFGSHDRRGSCGLGSVKSNIGHADAAAGIAGLIKTVLALKHRELPATLHYRAANAEIDLNASPFYVVDRLMPWETSADRRVAGVSSLGVGGTNCHVIVEEAPAAVETRADQSTVAPLVVVSAASEEAREELVGRFRMFLSQRPSPDLEQLARTTQRNRAHHAFRVAVRCSTLEECRDSFSSAVDRSLTGARRVSSLGVPNRWQGQAKAGTDPQIALLFPGQGSQYAGMGRALYDANPEFRRLLQQCERAVRHDLDRPLLDVMFGDADSGSSIQRTEYAQPALFALEYALAALLCGWGIRPRFVLGHSLGEYVAACVGGVFSVEQGLTLVAKRGRLMEHLVSHGKMLAVAATASVVEELLRPHVDEVSIAAINAPTQIVVSGGTTAIERFEDVLRTAGIAARALRVSQAFHSPRMIPALQPLEELLRHVDLAPPTLRLISNLTGRAVTTEVTDPRYWSAHAREPVRFAASIQTLINEDCEVIVEIGPDGVLSHMVREVDSSRRLRRSVTGRLARRQLAAFSENLHVRDGPRERGCT